MGGVGRTRRVTQLVFLALSVVVLLSLSGFRPVWGVAGDPAAEADLGSLANRERVARGLGSLVEAGDLVTVARRHSGRMLSRDDVFHNPNLSSEVDGWELLGENVGMGATTREIHEALMGSKVHRDVILDPRFTEVGVGVLVENGEFWVTQVFRQPEEQQSSPVTSAPPEPATTTSTASGAGGATGEEQGTVSAAGAPARVPAPASRPVQEAGAGRAVPPTAGGPTTSSPAEEAAEVAAPPATTRIEPVVIDSATPVAAVSVPVPLPEPPEIPALGLVAAGLLLLVVGSASATTIRAVAAG